MIIIVKWNKFDNEKIKIALKLLGHFTIKLITYFVIWLLNRLIKEREDCFYYLSYGFILVKESPFHSLVRISSLPLCLRSWIQIKYHPSFSPNKSELLTETHILQWQDTRAVSPVPLLNFSLQTNEIIRVIQYIIRYNYIVNPILSSKASIPFFEAYTNYS